MYGVYQRLGEAVGLGVLAPPPVLIKYSCSLSTSKPAQCAEPQKPNTECLAGCSRSRFPPWPAALVLNLLRLPLIPVSACANSRVIPGARNAMLAAPMRSSLPQIRFPHSDAPRVHFEGKRAVRGSMRARTARLTVPTGQVPLNPFPHPHRRACQRAHSCQRRCRPPLRYGPSGDCRSERRPSWRHRDGEHQEFRPTGGFNPSGGIEQGTGSSPELLKFYRSR